MTHAMTPADQVLPRRGVCPVSDPAPHYAVLDEPDVRAVLRDHVRWPSRLGPGLAYAQPNGVLVASDPPAHTAQRARLSAAFRPAATAALAGTVTALVDDLVARHLPRGRADLITDLAAPMSLSVVCGLLGLRTEHIADYWDWVLKLGQGLMYPAGSMDRRVVGAYRAFYEHFNPHLKARRAALDAGETPPEDLLTTLMAAGPDGRALNRSELLAFCQFLLVAGSSTTALLIGNLTHRLLSTPDQLALLRADRSLLAAAIEESLRVDTPLRGLFRTSACPAQLGGADIPADAKVLVMFAEANRDPATWRDPDTFDVTRDVQTLRRHYSFGHGAHYCLGAPLARLEATTMMSALLDRLPGLRLAGPPVPVSADILNGYASVPIAWDS